MGAPNATATPAAHAALSISRRLAGGTHEYRKKIENWELTFIIFILAMITTDNVAYAARNVDERSLLA
jgi:hypothetical protein